jgi:hypothetical protein
VRCRYWSEGRDLVGMHPRMTPVRKERSLSPGRGDLFMERSQ